MLASRREPGPIVTVILSWRSGEIAGVCFARTANRIPEASSNCHRRSPHPLYRGIKHVFLADIGLDGANRDYTSGAAISEKPLKPRISQNNTTMSLW